jgi:peptidoglycan/xylan/chitin deacetylase (PgdA/CDA1 family)
MFYRGAAHEPLLGSARRVTMRGRAVVLMYHEVLEDDCRIDAWTVVRQGDFLRQMQYIKRAFSVLTLEEAADALRKGTRAPIAVVTFDDGYAGNLRVALPIVESLGISMTVFIATRAVTTQALYWYDRVILTLQQTQSSELDLRAFGLRRYRLPGSHAGRQHWTAIQQVLTDLKNLPPERREDVVGAIESPEVGASPELRPLSIDEVRRLSKSRCVAIGSHSHCHNRLCQLAPDAVDDTIVTCKRLLESWTDAPVRSFSYPNGDYNDGIVSAVRRHGFSLAVTTRSRTWAPSDSPFEIPRVGIGGYDGWNRFRTVVSGILL